MRIAAAITLLSTLAVAQSAAAHVPNIASFHLIPGDDAWRLEVNMSTNGMHQALQASHPGEALSTFTPEAYERLLISALREGIELHADGVALSLDHPIVEVRSHASRVVFVMTPPRDVHHIDAHIDALNSRGGQNNVFRFLGQPVSRIVLKSDNNFRGRLELSAPTLELAHRPRKAGLLFPVGLLLLGLGLGLTGSGLRSIHALT